MTFLLLSHCSRSGALFIFHATRWQTVQKGDSSSNRGPKIARRPQGRCATDGGMMECSRTELRSQNSRNVIVLLGGPGAGKGTQAHTIAAWLNIPHISTVQLLRTEVAAQSELGLRVRTLIDAGELVADDIVNELVERRIRELDCTFGFILDGYPRDERQAVSLRRNLAKTDR